MWQTVNQASDRIRLRPAPYMSVNSDRLTCQSSRSLKKEIKKIVLRQTISYFFLQARVRTEFQKAGVTILTIGLK